MDRHISRRDFLHGAVGSVVAGASLGGGCSPAADPQSRAPAPRPRGRTRGSGGFDPATDIEGIAVNRWPHGYAFQPNPLFDPDYGEGEAPHEIGRRRFGRIAIANSDAGARAYLDAAIDQAWRAVAELSD